MFTSFSFQTAESGSDGAESEWNPGTVVGREGFCTRFAVYFYCSSITVYGDYVRDGAQEPLFQQFLVAGEPALLRLKAKNNNAANVDAFVFQAAVTKVCV